MRFSFIHAADLHVDSPLAALGAKDASVALRFAQAGRKAVTALVDEAISSKAAFLIIAGDMFDGDWRDYSTGLFMVRELSRLVRAKIPAFIIKGNHDAESIVSRNLRDPPGVTVFGGHKAEMHLLEDFRVALHGRSFPKREPPAGFVASYPKPQPGYLNIGILHTALDGTRGDHAAYAPCTVQELAAFGYDYWALGHIHGREIVSKAPWIVYPGNIQGRSVRETGAKGAMRVSVEDGRIASVEPVILDAARWAHERLDISGCASHAEMDASVEACLARVHAGAQGRAVALRLTLHGSSALHSGLSARRDDIIEDIRARALHLADDFWVERLVIESSLPQAPVLWTDTLDIAALLGQAATAPGFAASVVEITASLSEKLPRELRDGFGADSAALLAQARDLLLGRLNIDGAERR